MPVNPKIKLDDSGNPDIQSKSEQEVRNSIPTLINSDTYMNSAIDSAKEQNRNIATSMQGIGDITEAATGVIKMVRNNNMMNVSKKYIDDIFNKHDPENPEDVALLATLKDDLPTLPDKLKLGLLSSKEKEFFVSQLEFFYNKNAQKVAEEEVTSAKMFSKDITAKLVNGNIFSAIRQRRSNQSRPFDVKTLTINPKLKDKIKEDGKKQGRPDFLMENGLKNINTEQMVKESAFQDGILGTPVNDPNVKVEDTYKEFYQKGRDENYRRSQQTTKKNQGARQQTSLYLNKVNDLTRNQNLTSIQRLNEVIKLGTIHKVLPSTESSTIRSFAKLVKIKSPENVKELLNVTTRLPEHSYQKAISEKEIDNEMSVRLKANKVGKETTVTKIIDNKSGIIIKNINLETLKNYADIDEIEKDTLRQVTRSYLKQTMGGSPVLKLILNGYDELKKQNMTKEEKQKVKEEYDELLLDCLTEGDKGEDFQNYVAAQNMAKKGKQRKEISNKKLLDQHKGGIEKQKKDFVASRTQKK